MGAKWIFLHIFKMVTKQKKLDKFVSQNDVVQRFTCNCCLHEKNVTCKRNLKFMMIWNTANLYGLINKAIYWFFLYDWNSMWWVKNIDTVVNIATGLDIFQVNQDFQNFQITMHELHCELTLCMISFYDKFLHLLQRL